MRTLTDKQIAALRCPTGYATHLRVYVQDSSGAWRNVKGLAGAEWEETADDSVTICTVTYALGAEGKTLSPWNESSSLNNVGGVYSPLLAPGAAFRVEVATIPTGTLPESGDWVSMFEGTFDLVETPGEGVVLAKGRDHAGRILDAFIEEVRDYGDDTTGVALQDVIQGILDDNGFSSTTLYVPIDPLRQVGRYEQDKVATLAAIRTLANRIGWDVKMRWVEGDGWRFTLFSPNRLKTTPDWAIPRNGVLKVTEVREDRLSVRNAVEVVYWDKGDRDASGKPKRKSYVATDPTSIAQFGRLFMPITEGASSNIDSEAEAERFGDSAIADLSLPLSIMELEVPFSWHLESGDLLTVPALGNLSSGAMDLALFSIRHRVVAGGKATSRLHMRGIKPMLSDRRVWMPLDSRPGFGPARQKAGEFAGPLAPTSVAATPVVNGFAVSFVQPTGGVEAEEYELHLSTSSGFTPSTASGSTTFKARGKSSRFEVTDLTPGTTYYAKVLPLDRNRNYGTASAEVSFTPRYVEPRLLLPRCSYGSLPLNADMEAQSDSAAPPDGWSMSTGAWGTAVTSTSDAFSGTRALSFAASTNSEIHAQPFTCKEGERLVLSVAYKSTGSGSTGAIRLDFVSSSLVLLSSSTLSLTAAASWSRLARSVPVPVGTRYCRLAISRENTHDGVLTVDGTEVLRIPAYTAWHLVEPEGESGTYGIFSNGWDNYDAVNYYAAAYRANDIGEVEVRGRLQAPSPAPPTSGVVFRLPYSPTKKVFQRIQTATGNVGVTIDTSGNLSVDIITAGSELSLDGLRYTTD